MKPFALPFGAGKPKHESIYGDIYARCLAAGIDISILFLLLYERLEIMSRRYFPDVTPQLFEQVANTHDVAVRGHLLGQWFGMSMMQFFIIGVVLVMFQIFYGTTPGKWLVGLKIVRHGSHAPVEWWRYVLRYIAYAPACLSVIGLLCMSFNKERRGLHDYIAGTVVLNLRLRGWYWNHLKRFVAKLRGKPPLAPEDAVGKPAPEKRHTDGNDAV